MKFVKIALSVYRLPSTAEVRSRKTEDKIKNGFTLAEMLVVMAITAIMGTILVTIFTNTLRGSNKAQILAVIKQNGQAVLEDMDKTIRDADNVVCVTSTYPLTTPPSGATLVLVKKGLYNRYRFIPPDNDGTLISGACGSRNGCLQQDNPVQPVPPATKSDIKLFIDSICLDTDPLAVPAGSTTPVTLTDINTQSGVSVNSGALFTRIRQPGSKDTVTVSFTLSPGVQAPSVLSSQIDPVTFQTTVQLR